MENEYKQYFRKDRIKDFYFLSYFIFILSLIGETDVNEEENNDDEKEPVDEEKVNTSTSEYILFSKGGFFSESKIRSNPKSPNLPKKLFQKTILGLKFE